MRRHTLASFNVNRRTGPIGYRLLLAAILVSLGQGCIGMGGPFGLGGAPPPIPLNAELALADDPRFVVRDRLDLAGADRRDGIRGTSFSHRSQRFHVYPFTTYGGSRVEIKINVRDPRIAERSALWVLGPKSIDGNWGGVRSATGAQAAVEIEATGLGEYIAVVGPADAGGFLPRYPGVEAVLELEAEDGFEEETARFVSGPNDEVRLVFAGEFDPDPEFGSLSGRVFRIFEPVTQKQRVDALPANPFELIFAEECPDAACRALDESIGNVSGKASGKANGNAIERELFTFAPRSWTRYQLFAPEDAVSLDDTRIAAINDPQEGDFTVFTPRSPHTPEATYRILDALGADGRPNFPDPAMLRVVPLQYGDCEVDVIEGPRCDDDGDACRIPTCLGRSGPAPDDLPVRAFRATALDIDETSLYDIEARCDGVCSPVAAPTRYPVYLAHGFNSSKEVWDDVTYRVVETDPRWNHWLAAESVPAFEPVWRRAEQLRRNLAQYLRGLETLGVQPPDGEPYQRLNVIAHSMGGLDSRVLLGDPQYNNPQCHVRLECTDADGHPEACCSADAQGDAITWRERIASVTTLSTPHRGSSFADVGVALLENRSVDWAFRKAARYVLGLETEQEQKYLRETLFTLSNQFSAETMTPRYSPVQPERAYSFACATRVESCEVPANSDLPSAAGTLPPPNAHTTFFGWASEACVTGSCGSIVDPGLALSYGIVKQREGSGDGVVATRSAEFGIFMGVRANDHFHWNRLSFAQVVELAARAFGIRREPVDRFYIHWLGTLSRSGY